MVKKAHALDKELEDYCSHAKTELDEMFPQSKEEQLVQEAVDTVFQNEEQRQREALDKFFQAVHGGYHVLLTPLKPDGSLLGCTVQRTKSREQCVKWLAEIFAGRHDFHGIWKDGQMMSGSEYDQLLKDANERADDLALRFPHLYAPRKRAEPK